MPPEQATTEAGAEVNPKTQKIVLVGENTRSFERYHWRQAIKQYLAWLWTKRFSHQETLDLHLPTYAPRHSRDGNGSVILRYCAVSEEFNAFGSYDQSLPPSMYHVRKESVQRVRVERPEQLQIALARFAWDHQIRVLRVDFGLRETGMEKLWLWSARGALSVYEKIMHEDLS